ncbi:carboxylesterase family domain-containing protein [Ditylenchus destructor]|nr:carboxylesterase family domain-containing protein [Ditylenchus destructor]
MGTEDEAKAYEDPVIYYGKAWAWLNIHYAFHNNKNRLLLAKKLTKEQEKQYFGNRIKEGLSKKINVRCLQPKRSPTGKPEGKDECLTLNVIAPPITDAKHPVYVHIHGGSLVSGAAEAFGYKGLVRNFATQNIIVVTLNYRLGPEGFLKVPFLTDEERKKHAGYVINRGIEDCILALHWVKNNIAYFGGDVNNITLGGNSAGASIVEMIALQENQLNNEHSTPV